MMLKPLMGCNGPLVWTDTQLPTAALREGYPTGSRTTRSRQILAGPDYHPPGVLSVVDLMAPAGSQPSPRQYIGAIRPSRLAAVANQRLADL